jgi:hypothetical protein
MRDNHPSQKISDRESRSALLSSEQRREINQLLFVARHYLRVVSKSALRTKTKMGVTKAAFEPGRSVPKSTRRRTIAVANLASAAFRLTAIEEILSTSRFRECRDYFNGKRSTDHRGSTCSEWFHIMLRDSVGHSEPSPASNTKAQRYLARQSCIEETSLPRAHTQLRAIARMLEEEVQTPRETTDNRDLRTVNRN